MKLFTFNKSYLYILTTLLCLVFLGANYFFIYLPKNEKIIEEQRFRTLQNVDRNIHSKIDNSLSLINNLMVAFEKNGSLYLNRYIDKYPKDNFVLSPIAYLPINKAPKDSVQKDSVLNAPNLIVNDATKEITLLLRKQSENSKVSAVKQIIQGTVTYSFKQFIGYLLPDAVFDEYIVFSKDHTVYETFPSGIINVREDSLFNSKNGIGGSYVRDITVGGMDYKLFLQPVTFDSKNKWVLGGLLSKSRYLQERSELPKGIIMLLGTIVLGMMIIYPWIKLYQMGSKDRLTLTDGASIILASMLLMSLLFFCFFKYNISVRGGNSPNSKKTLANKISNAFYNETKEAYTLLHTYNSFKNKHKDIDDIVNLNNKNISYADKNQKKNNVVLMDDSATKAFFKPLKNNAIDQVFWLDSNGEEKLNWTSDSLNSPAGNFKVRNYFNNIIKLKGYNINGDVKKEYYLDQVVSWNTGTFTSIISLPADSLSNSVAAMSFTMHSVQNVVLPTGYTFAIINNSGRVLYHSIGARNLNENLKTEFADSTNIVSCINSRAEGEFNTKYYSKNYTVTVTPIKDLPYFIVIFSDTGYNEVRDVEIYSFTFSMLLLFFLYIVLQLCITFIISSRRSFFKKQLFDTSWIGPKISCHKDYLLSFCNNSIVVFLLMVCFQRVSFLPYFFLLLFAVTYISLFLNVVFIIRYVQLENENNIKFKSIAVRYKSMLFRHNSNPIIIWSKLIVITICYIKTIAVWYKVKAVLWLLFMLLVINVAAFGLLSNNHFKHFFIGIELMTMLIGAVLCFFVVFWKNKKTIENKMVLSAERNYIKSFSLMAFTNLIITSGIPIAFFYVTSYNYEQNLGIRHRQTDYANRLLEQAGFQLDTIDKQTIEYYKIGFQLNTVDGRPAKIYGFLMSKSVTVVSPPKIQDTAGIYIDSAWISAMPTIVGHESINKNFDAIENMNTRKILGNFHLTIGDKSILTNKLYIPYSADTSVVFQPLLINTNADSSVSTFRQTTIAGKYLKLDSYNLNYILPPFFGGFGSFLYWLLLVLVLLVFYFVMNNILKKLFCLNLPDLKIWQQLDYKLLTDNNLNKFIFVIGLPGAGKFNYILDKIKSDEIKYSDDELLVYDQQHLNSNNVFVADLINIPDTGAEIEKDAGWINFCEQAIADKNRLVIINHFEYNIQDEYTNMAKLNFLEQLMLKRKSKIIILSTIHPVSFLDSLNASTKNLDGTIRPSHNLERWNVLLGHYRIALIPIIKLDIKRQPGWKQLISQETDYTQFLQEMQQVTLDVAASLNGEAAAAKRDELAYKLQVTAHYFYMYIWQSLTKEEKFLLYDLAEDNLVNSYDDHNLTMLIAKGVIHRSNGSLQLFNKGFRNFILTAIGNIEAMKIKDRIKESGNWTNLKTPLIIVILAILSFLLISQQEAYSKLLAYLAALTTGVPAVLKILSLFDKNTSKTNP